MSIFGGKGQHKLERKYSSDGILFSSTGQEKILFPLGKNSPEVLSKLMPNGSAWAVLEELWEEELLVESDLDLLRLLLEFFGIVSLAEKFGVLLHKAQIFEIVTRSKKGLRRSPLFVS